MRCLPDMEHSRFPIDIRELTIDSCQQDPDIEDEDMQHLKTLRACALTCRDWLPRSRANLYVNVLLVSGDRVASFFRTIAAHPFLADFVSELVVGPTSTTNGGGRGAYLPFAHNSLRSVRCLTLRCFDWQAHHPRYYEVVACYPIVKLEIKGGHFGTLANMFRIVWAFKQLRDLTLVDVILPGKRGISPSATLKHKKHPPCSSLERLAICGSGPLESKGFLRRGRLGTSLTVLKLTWTEVLGDRPTEKFLSFALSMKRLAELSWWVRFRTSRTDRAWYTTGMIEDCSAYVASTLARFTSHSKLRGGVKTIETLQLTIPERLPAQEETGTLFDSAWWTSEIHLQQSSWPTAVGLVVRVSAVRTPGAIWPQETLRFGPCSERWPYIDKSELAIDMVHVPLWERISHRHRYQKGRPPEPSTSTLPRFDEPRGHSHFIVCLSASVESRRLQNTPARRSAGATTDKGCSSSVRVNATMVRLKEVAHRHERGEQHDCVCLACTVPELVECIASGSVEFLRELEASGTPMRLIGKIIRCEHLAFSAICHPRQDDSVVIPTLEILSQYLGAYYDTQEQTPWTWLYRDEKRSVRRRRYSLNHPPVRRSPEDIVLSPVSPSAFPSYTLSLLPQRSFHGIRRPTLPHQHMNPQKLSEPAQGAHISTQPVGRR